MPGRMEKTSGSKYLSRALKSVKIKSELTALLTKASSYTWGTAHVSIIILLIIHKLFF